MNDEFDPTVGPGPDPAATDYSDPVNAAGNPAEPAPSEPVIPPAAPDSVPEAPAAYAAPEPSPAAYAAPAAPAYQPTQPAYQPQPAQPAYQTAQPAYPPQQPVYPPQQPVGQSPYETAAPQEPRPGRKSPYAPMTSVGMAVQIFLMSIPVLGLILSILWACGVCRKIVRRNLARAYLILLIIGILLLAAAAIVLRFCFADEITRLFEQVFPGYTIKWG